MDWSRVRAEYARRLKLSGATQATVAAAGGLPRQNVISKLLANQKRGPSVETFCQAVEGLGLDLSSFFATLEHGPAGPCVQITTIAHIDTVHITQGDTHVYGRSIEKIAYHVRPEEAESSEST